MELKCIKHVAPTYPNLRDPSDFLTIGQMYTPDAVYITNEYTAYEINGYRYAGENFELFQSHFSSNQFRIFDATDVTKEISFVASGITSGNRRTITMPDMNVTLGAGGTGYISGAVNTYADLPDVVEASGSFYLVKTGSGIYLINRKPAGLYYSNGTTWESAPDIVPFFSSNNFRIYDNTDDSKMISLVLSGLSGSTTRALTIQDKDGTIACISDLPDITGKVDKVVGKELSTNDFTDALETKLNGIAESANNYSHPNHSGDVTSSGDGAQTIANSAVSLAKMANLAQNTIIGRITASTGVPEALTGANIRTISSTPEASGLAKISVGTATPSSPATGDLWIDVN